MADSDEGPELRQITFDELGRRIAKFQKNAKEGGRGPAWGRLAELNEELGGTGASSEELVDGRRWSLGELSVRGFQGVGESEPLLVDFEGGPGITVVHGQNGAGKSSVTDAVQLVLRGELRAPGKASDKFLWERRQSNRDSAETRIDLVLRDGTTELRLGIRLDQNGVCLERTAEMRLPGEDWKPVATGRAWPAALLAHPPVFAYADIERRVQQTSNLKSFLTDLLAFGLCFDALRDRAAERADAAVGAFARVRTAQQEAVAAIEAVDREFAMDEGDNLDPIAWPEVPQDIESWLAREGLTEEGAAHFEVAADAEQALTGAADLVSGAVDGWWSAVSTLQEELSKPLQLLHRDASVLDSPGVTCPVCDTDEVDWLNALAGNVDRLEKLNTRRGLLESGTRELTRLVQQHLVLARTVLTSSATAQCRFSAEDDQVVDRYLRAVAPGADSSGAEQLTVTAEMCAWLRGDRCAALLAEARTRGDRLANWRKRRRAAVAVLVEQWRQDAELAAEKKLWDEVRRCVTTLEGRLRDRQVDVLGARVTVCTQVLLEGMGLKLDQLEVNKNTAVIDIVDDEGKPVDLSMLSSGQRNALLLAPLLATSSTGPFEFLVLDDPVHAFDEIRVDRLARLLARLAEKRRVIVFTHDERLKENLLAFGRAADLRSIERDPATGGVVRLRKTGEMWRVLLDDAAELRRIAQPSDSKFGRPVEDLVRCLFRQAIDNALRQGVIKYAVAKQEEPSSLTDDLDEKWTTKERLKWVRRRIDVPDGVRNPVKVVEDEIEPYNKLWNLTMHGSSAHEPLADVEFDTAEKACLGLTELCPR
ncbi:energy-coupling factor transporter ATP-binding protein EcfA2 [Crossiella equi]|uniref:Nuclease SbcCD subunit C n=1 Tax=Crossiella equi TaxID=130796 RepID=A0ABS5AQ39_9PSEU|nr:ATP-binding protein [Crossiella equi]MBP2478367.1 energy-coupling factor transporter ATP-binding protein EcfA2 [Crossiella equi]